MSRNIGLVALVVRDYDEAIEFYVDRLGFALVEYSPVLAQAKRWVVLAPGAPGGAQLLLARAVGEEQVARIGNQTGVRVFLSLHTDDFWRHYQTYQERGVEFVRPPRQESYGIIAVFAERRLQSRLTKGKQRLTVGSSTFSKHLTFLRAVKVNSLERLSIGIDCGVSVLRVARLRRVDIDPAIRRCE